MIKNIVGDVHKLIHAGISCLHSVQKHYAFRNTQNSVEDEYFHRQLEKIKLHIELDKTELARRKNMLAEEGTKAKAKAEQWGPTVHVNEEELQQVVSGLQAGMHQELVNKLALTENRLQRAVRDCRVAVDAHNAMQTKNTALMEQFTAATATSASKVKDLEDKLADCGVRETRLNNEIQFLKKALSQTTGVPILAATQQVKVE